MATYRMTPARRAALEKAQAASAAKRRRLATKSRRSRLANRKTLALVGGVAATVVVANTAGQIAASRYRSDTNEMVQNHRVELRYEALLEKKRREYQYLLKLLKKRT